MSALLTALTKELETLEMSITEAQTLAASFRRTIDYMAHRNGTPEPKAAIEAPQSNPKAPAEKPQWNNLIRDAVANGAQTPSEIFQATGLNPKKKSAVYPALSYAHEKGVVVRQQDGTYRLPGTRKPKKKAARQGGPPAVPATIHWKLLIIDVLAKAGHALSRDELWARLQSDHHIPDTKAVRGRLATTLPAVRKRGHIVMDRNRLYSLPPE
jgi:hypothetical protein